MVFNKGFIIIIDSTCKFHVSSLHHMLYLELIIDCMMQIRLLGGALYFVTLLMTILEKCGLLL